MPDVYSTLESIAASRKDDSLRPITFVTPSHASGLQLRRILASHGPFAAVRFETLPRLAELIAAGFLAENGRAPLARPIGDYLAEQVALESREGLSRISDLPGYARALRRIFNRFRRAGVIDGSAATAVPGSHLAEILRLYGLFRQRSSAFYDAEDLLQSAAETLDAGRAGIMADLGEIFVVPPGPLTASANQLTEALGRVSGSVHLLERPTGSWETRVAMSSDPATEVADVVRNILRDLEAGTRIDEIAVFHGDSDLYPRLLREAFAAADVPAAPLPGVPVIETRAGRSLVQLAELPGNDYSRTAVFDFLEVAPLRFSLPTIGGDTVARVTSWDSITREAGITHGAATWADRLSGFAVDRAREASILTGRGPDYESRARRAEYQSHDATEVAGVVAALIERLVPLEREQPAGDFIASFKSLVHDYLEPSRDPDPGAMKDGLDEALEEIDQLGAIGAVGGTFALQRFTAALRANLESAHIRPRKLGDGVVLASYRSVAGLRFKNVYLCGAYEGAFPSGAGGDTLLDDSVWRALKTEYPSTEDVQTRLERGREAVRAAEGSANGGVVTWSCPAYEPGGARDYYPAPEMVRAAGTTFGSPVTAAQLRTGSEISGGRPSPLGASLRGPVLNAAELGLRRAVELAREGRQVHANHDRFRPVTMLNSRSGNLFTEWEGRVGTGLVDVAGRRVSPTSLEKYSECGFRYLASSVLYLRAVEEPSATETISPMDRGSLVHSVLELFFKEEQASGRPGVRERWTANDRDRLHALADEEFQRARARGIAGLGIYSQHEVRTIQADLERFLEEDNDFRAETGAVPASFEDWIPESEVSGVIFRGSYDRMDATPDGRNAWVMDYKTGSTFGFKGFEEDPLLGGLKLQAGMYGYNVPGADHVTAIYWFISNRGEFERKSAVITDDVRKRLETVVGKIVDGIATGVFPAVSGDANDFTGSFDNCKFCDFTRICPVNRDDAFERKRADAAIAPWLAIAEAGALP